MRLARLIGTWFLLPLVIGGCRAPVVASYAAPEGLAADENGLRVGPLEPRGSIRSDWLRAEDQRERIFEQTDADGRSRVVRTAERVGSGVEMVTRAEGSDEPIRIVLLDEERGQLRTTRVESGGITNEFTPGAIYLPAQLNAGERIEESFLVHSDGRGIRGESGTGTVRIEGLGSQRIATPSGLYDAFVFRWEMQLKVGAATISLRQTAWVDRDEGLVAETARDRVSVFGIPIQHEDRVSVLSEVRP